MRNIAAYSTKQIPGQKFGLRFGWRFVRAAMCLENDSVCAAPSMGLRLYSAGIYISLSIVAEVIIEFTKTEKFKT